MFSGLGHRVYSVKPSVKKVILEEENASLASVEAMLTQKTLKQHANNIPGMQTLANLYHLYHWITINTTKQTCMNAQMYVNICILRVSFRQRDTKIITKKMNTFLFIVMKTLLILHLHLQESLVP